MSGFGHRVYKNYDPRAKVIRKLAEEVFSIVGRDPLIEVYFFFKINLIQSKLAFVDIYFIDVLLLYHDLVHQNLQFTNILSELIHVVLGW